MCYSLGRITTSLAWTMFLSQLQSVLWPPVLLAMVKRPWLRQTMCPDVHVPCHSSPKSGYGLVTSHSVAMVTATQSGDLPRDWSQVTRSRDKSRSASDPGSSPRVVMIPLPPCNWCLCKVWSLFSFSPLKLVFWIPTIQYIVPCSSIVPSWNRIIFQLTTIFNL